MIVEVDFDLAVADNPERHRFEASVDGQPAGYSTYDLGPDRVVFLHTKVKPEFEGRGVGSRLAKFAVEDVRGRGLRITPVCPFIRAYLKRHREFDSIVDYPVETAGEERVSSL